MEGNGKSAFRFVLLLGVVSLFADATYESARSITGPFLATLGASGAVVGIVAGFGELIGYALRLLSGYIADRTRQYWTLTIIGYVVNMGAVPLLAFAGRWEIAVVLIIAERVGKAIRTPARDAMLSHAASQIGRGWAFGVHEAMDQIGAVAGPLFLALILHAKGSYNQGFAWLAIPAVLGLSFLIAARLIYPNPREFEMTLPHLEGKGLPRVFWIYLAAAGLVAAGYTDFPLIAFHLKKSSITTDQWIPVLYAVAMGVDAAAALLFGKLFDRMGLSVLVIATAISTAFAPFVFLGDIRLAIVGMTLWGIGMGAQESIMRAAVGTMVSAERRASAYGLFNAIYGAAWFAGSALMGFLYDISIPFLIAFSVVTQTIAIIILLRIPKK